MAKVGIIGCGNISQIYLEANQKFPILEIVACADIDIARAQAKAAEHNIKAYSVSALLADPEIEIVINLTIPAVHAEIGLATLAAGKAAYSEKPFALTASDGDHLLSEAKRNGLRIGCAPDTFLGGGLQTCRKLIDQGVIGTPVAATAFMMSPGHESWHPNPEFFYKAGGGPMFDMGPYYLTALTSLLGPVRRVTGSTRITYPERTITSQPLAGQKISVDVPTHVSGTLDFESGVLANIITSFDVHGSELPRMEIYGSEGSLSLPDPNTFGGPVYVRKPGRDSEWEKIPIIHHYTENSRGLGVADMAHAMRSGRAHRASGELANHVLEIMCAIHDASDSGGHVLLKSHCERPAPLPSDLPVGVLDE